MVQYNFKVNFNGQCVVQRDFAVCVKFFGKLLQSVVEHSQINALSLI